MTISQQHRLRSYYEVNRPLRPASAGGPQVHLSRSATVQANRAPNPLGVGRPPSRASLVANLHVRNPPEAVRDVLLLPEPRAPLQTGLRGSASTDGFNAHGHPQRRPNTPTEQAPPTSPAASPPKVDAQDRLPRNHGTEQHGVTRAVLPEAAPASPKGYAQVLASTLSNLREESAPGQELFLAFVREKARLRKKQPLA
jgi:hypothetical protein